MQALLTVAASTSILCGLSLLTTPTAATQPDPPSLAASSAVAAAPIVVAPSVPTVIGGVPIVGEITVTTEIVPRGQRSDAAALLGGGPGNPLGENALAPDGFCCMFSVPPCPNTPGTYSVGDDVFLNSYWTETLPADPGPEWIAGLTVGVTLPDGSFLPLADGARLNFGDLSAFAGQEIVFCAAVQLVIPATAAGTGTVDQMLGVTSLQGGFAPVMVNALTVN